MNQPVGHFLISWSRSEDRVPGWSYLLLPLLLIFLLVLDDPVFAQGPDHLLRDANEYYENEQYHTAAQYYQVALGLQPANPEANYRLAQCYRAIFDYPLAANYYKKARELDEASFPLAAFYQAQMDKSMGNFKNAKDGFEYFIKASSNSTLISTQEKQAFIKQAEIEIEGSKWAIEQLGKSWQEMGFRIMPEPVNSPFNDYAAVTVDTTQTLTITSGRKGARGSLVDNRFGEFFTDNFRYRRQNEQWISETTSDHFDRTNTKFSDGVGTYNSTGDKYYFTSCYEGNAFCKLYVTYRENGVWKNPQLLNENINAPGYDNKHPAITNGGDTLIFVSNRPGGSGGNDLWFSTSINEEDWLPPQPLPGNINTPFNEASPFCYGNGLLFFSSDGHPGVGSMDIFMVKAYTSPKSTIQNLGTPFNSGHDDSFFSLGPGIGYLSSNRPGGTGKFDIYTFNVPKQSENLASYLEESAQGTHLRSRIRENDGSNLYAVRDEDQFYYDNLTTEERQKLDRILSARQGSLGNFNPSELPNDERKYYKNLDIGTKAIIERLTQKRIMALDGQTAVGSLTPQQKLDWEFYQNVDEEERIIIDRIIDIKVEARRRATLNLDHQQQLYVNNTTNQERIDSKLQLNALSSESALINEQRQQAATRLDQNENVLLSSSLRKDELEASITHANQRAQEYQQTIDRLGTNYQVQYQGLAPHQRDDIHKSAVREFIITHSELTPEEKESLLSRFSLSSDPLHDSSLQYTNPNEADLIKIRDALKENIIAASAMRGNSSIQVLVTQELNLQQLMLQQQLQQLDQEELQVRELKYQVEQFIAQQHPSPNPGMEENIVQEVYQQSKRLLPLLSPKESFYLQSLAPGQQLRLDRLARLVEIQTKDYMQPSVMVEKKYLSNQLASDQWYYKGLSVIDQDLVDELVVNGWQDENAYSQRQNAFIAGLSQIERDRIDRMRDHYNRQSAIFEQNIARVEQKPALSGNVPSLEYVVQNQPGSMDNLSTNIYFDFNEYFLREEAKKALEELLDYLSRQGKPIRIVIEGHADNIGSVIHNDQLSQRRSESTAEFLKSYSNLIEVVTKGYGEEKPISNNKTAMGRQLNRRVELKFQGVPYQSSFQTFLVRPHATLEMIQAATGLETKDILSWNGLSNEELKPYQPLRLPTGIDYKSVNHLLYRPEEQPLEKDKQGYHTVQQGETYPGYH